MTKLDNLIQLKIGSDSFVLIIVFFGSYWNLFLNFIIFVDYCKKFAIA